MGGNTSRLLDLESPNDAWTLCEQPMLKARGEFSAVVYEGIMYAIGGKNDSGDLSSVESVSLAV